jgi:hypothetical protein
MDMEEIQRKLEHFHRDVEYYEAHQEEFLDLYPEQWVAVFSEQVVGACPDYERLLDELQENGVPLSSVYIQLATNKDEILIVYLV